MPSIELLVVGVHGAVEAVLSDVDDELEMSVT